MLKNGLQNKDGLQDRENEAWGSFCARCLSIGDNMAITTTKIDGGNTLKIRIDGRFDFSSHQAFRDAYEGNEKPAEGYCVDMTNATYLDSSALGMLLLLRDYAGGDNAQVTLANCNDDVRRILTISNFEQLFKIT